MHKANLDMFKVKRLHIASAKAGEVNRIRGASASAQNIFNPVESTGLNAVSTIFLIAETLIMHQYESFTTEGM